VGWGLKERHCLVVPLPTDVSPTIDAVGVSLEDELKILRFYSGEIGKLCSKLNFPTKVKVTNPCP